VKNEEWYFPQYDNAWNQWAFFEFTKPIYGDALRFYSKAESEKFLSLIENRFLCRKSQEVIHVNLVNKQIEKYKQYPMAKKLSFSEYFNLCLQNKYVDPSDLDKPSDIVDAHNNRILHKTDIRYEIYEEIPRLRILKIIFTDNVKYFPQVDDYFICTDFWRYSTHHLSNHLFTETFERSKEILNLIGNNLITKEIHWKLHIGMFEAKTLPYKVL
jgi:hypothetical protein